MGKPSVEYKADVWWPGGCRACRKLESVQMRVGRIILGASDAAVAVQGDLGWRKLKERREDMSVNC